MYPRSIHKQLPVPIMKSCYASLPLLEREFIAGLSQLTTAQQRIAELADRPVSVVDVPLCRVSGRVLAESIPEARWALTCGGPLLREGLSLSATHVPLLTEVQRATVRVFERVRVGVIALVSDDRALTGQDRCASQAATMLSAAIEQMGARAFMTTCRISDEGLSVRSVRAFAAECSLVLIVGTVDGELHAALKRSGVFGEASGLTGLSLPPFGDMHLARAGSAHVIALPADPTRALVTFMAFVSPLVRALGGRCDVLPPVSSAVMVNGDAAEMRDGEVRWVRERSEPSPRGISLIACPAGPNAASLAGATGLAWRAHAVDSDEAGTVTYLPLRSWIG